MILDATTRSIELLLEGAITTNELPWVVGYADHTDETFVPGAGSGLSNGATAVTIIAAPAASTQRQVKYLNVYNDDTVAHTITIRLNDNTNLRTIIETVSFSPGYQLVYTDTTGWKVTDETGKILILQSLSDEAIPKSIADAKGDLIAATAADAVARFAVSGRKFSTVYEDSAQSSGLKWGLRKYVELTPFDYATTCAVGDGAAYFHVPEHLDGLDLVEVHAEVITAGTTSTMTIQIYNIDNALDMLSTLLSIDSGETGSDEATPAVINPSNDHVNVNDMLRIDIDTVHTTAAIGLIVTLGFA